MKAEYYYDRYCHTLEYANGPSTENDFELVSVETANAREAELLAEIETLKEVSKAASALNRIQQKDIVKSSEQQIDLLAEIAELKKDRERLGFMLSDCRVIVVADEDFNEFACVAGDYLENRRLEGTGTTPREAIDNAMKVDK